MKIYTTTREDYLKAIYVLGKKIGVVRSVNLANYLGITKPSVCRAIGKLENEGFLIMQKDFSLHLTSEGLKVAENTYERFNFFANYLKSLGVDGTTAEEDACKLEHAISDISFKKLKEQLEG